MKQELFRQAIVKFLAGVLLLGLLIFLPAGTLRFWRGWLLMGVLFVPMFGAGLVMLSRAPELLRKRLDAKEQRGEQRRVIALSGLMFLAAFVLAGLNARFSWFPMPPALSWAAAGVFLLGYLLYAEVLRENAYLSRTVEVQQDQKLVDTGLYGLVRHPMYLATLLLFFSMPLILGSPLSLAVMLLYLPLIVRRIRDEEALLRRELPGYEDYCKRVKYRLLPKIW